MLIYLELICVYKCALPQEGDIGLSELRTAFFSNFCQVLFGPSFLSSQLVHLCAWCRCKQASNLLKLNEAMPLAPPNSTIQTMWTSNGSISGMWSPPTPHTHGSEASINGQLCKATETCPGKTFVVFSYTLHIDSVGDDRWLHIPCKQAQTLALAVTDYPAVTHFVLNAFLLFNSTTVILFFCIPWPSVD